MTIKQQGGIFGRNPTFNEVDATDITTESLSLLKNNPFVRLDDSDTDNNGEFRLDNTSVRIEADKDNAVAGSKIKFKIDNSEIGFFDENGHLDIDGNLIVASGQGIDFSATSGTGTSELFDDYEEGTWTPLFSDGTNNATMGLSNSGSYTKIGNLVTVTAYAQMSSKGSMSGNVRLTGLPYSVGSSVYGGGGVGFADFLSITAGQSIGLWTQASGTYLNVTLFDGTSGTSNLQASEMQNDGQFVFTLSYQT